MFDIPLSVPSFNGNELKYTSECIESEWVSTAGPFVGSFEKAISNYTKSKFSVACVNGTAALQVSLILAGVKPGDEVIAPTLTFIAPINAISYNGANPIFMDSDDYYNIDIDKTISFINNETIYKNGATYNKVSNKKISAIITVNVWGNAVFLDDLLLLCNERKIAVIEDASESLGTFYTKGNFKNKHSGTIGNIGCLSFNGNKIITSGGGGMILTDNEQLANKAKYLTTQAKDDPIHYIHDEVGYNHRLTNIQAAIGLAQLERLPEFLKRKSEINLNYSNYINEIDGLSLAKTPDYSMNNHWLNLIKIKPNVYIQTRNELMEKMTSKGVQTRPVWSLNHLQKPYLDCQNYNIENANEMVENSLCLPSSVNLKDIHIEKIISVLNG